MKICIMGTGRSGTTALYSLLQQILAVARPPFEKSAAQTLVEKNVDYIYEPFLWEKDVFNDNYYDVMEKFRYMDSISVEGVYNHLKLPLFIKESQVENLKKKEYLSMLFNNNSPHTLIKFIRANGRYHLMNDISPECKYIFIIRNPLDVINSLVVRFSFFGSEFHRDDFKRFIDEVNLLYGYSYEADKIQSQVERECLYWYYMNRFALESFAQAKNKPLVIQYEHYITHYEELVGRICDFLGIAHSQKYHQFAKRQGGSKTNSININQQEFEEISVYMESYKELLKDASIEDYTDYEQLNQKYSCLAPGPARQDLILGKNSNFVNNRLMRLEQAIEQRNGEIKVLKSRVSQLEAANREMKKKIKWKLLKKSGEN